MSRYVFSYTVGDSCELYLESTPEEDRLDQTDGVTLVEFTGNGYLHFWTRCKKLVRDYKRFHEAATGNSYVEYLGISHLSGQWDGEGTITDLWYGDEKTV